MKILGLSRNGWRERFVKLAAMIWRRLLFRTTFIAITGSVGKTTTKELLTAILSRTGPTVATPDTSNSPMNLAQAILRMRPRTRFAVLEIGTDRPGLIRRGAFIVRPDIAVILNVGRTHTNRFPALEDTAREKSALLTGLRASGVAILNQDDPLVAAMATGRGFRVVSFGLGDTAEVRGADLASTFPERLTFTITRAGATQRVETRLVGVHWASAVLGATAAALECGVSLQQIADAVARVEPFPGRMDPRAVPCGAVIVRDDFNGSLQTFQAAFRVLREARATRKFLAITSVSDSPESWGMRMRRIVTDAVGVVDTILLVGKPFDTKRTAKEAVAAGFRTDQVHCFAALAEVAEFLSGFLRAGDLLLLRDVRHRHMGRLYYSQIGEVRCWIERCTKTIDCQQCPELFGAAPPGAATRSSELVSMPSRNESR